MDDSTYRHLTTTWMLISPFSLTPSAFLIGPFDTGIILAFLPLTGLDDRLPCSVFPPFGRFEVEGFEITEGGLLGIFEGGGMASVADEGSLVRDGLGIVAEG